MVQRREFRILLVEDEAGWRMALADKYRQLLHRDFVVSIDSVAGGPEAIARLQESKRSPFDLLSLDVNLGLGHPRDGDLPSSRLEGADGRTVLRKASEWGACKGVVVVSGLHHDASLSVILGGESEVQQVKTNIGGYLQRLFPARSLFYSKAQLSAEEFVAVWDLTRGDLIRISATPNAVLTPPYELDYEGDVVKPGRVVVRSRGSKVQEFVKDPKDAQFLVALASFTREVGFIAFESAAAILHPEGRQGVRKEIEKYVEKPGVSD